MIQVDFYILSPGVQGDRFTFACRLADKAYQQGRRVFLHTADGSQAHHLDRLLWVFRQGSFIPHGLQGEADPSLTPVLIGCSDSPAAEQDVLVNLGDRVPGFFNRFSRVIEVVEANPEARSQGRERFRFYRDRGYPPTPHDIEK